MNTAELNLGSPGGVSTDTLAKLETALSVAIGKPYLFACMAYGNELTLHFGAERKHSHPKLAGKVRGTLVLSVRGSGWILQSGIKKVMVGCGVVPTTVNPAKTKPFNVTALESGALIGQGATIVRAVPLAVVPLDAIGLRVELSDGSSFTILPTPPSNDGDGLPEPADWELLTPTQVLRVGPGPNFTVDPNGLSA